jgi:polyisoprenyl-phosphate glycosyltransferase
MGNNLEISVVVPVYGCSECLRSLCDRLVSSLSTYVSDFELILVVDCSPDSSWQTLEELAIKDKRIKGILFSRNFGQHYAISAGLDYAKGNWVAVMDCDLQDRPEDIQVLYERTKEGFDVVYGFSSFRGKKSFLRNFFRKIYIYLYDSLVKTNYKTANLSFFIMHSKVKDAIIQYRENSRHISTIVREVGFRITGVQVQHLEREIGVSSYNFSKRLKLALTGIVNYSTVLLKLALIIGFSFSILSFIMGLIILLNRLFGKVYYPGWASIAVLILFSTGITLTFLGILGIYLQKIFSEVRKRPLYIVSEKINI